MLLMVMVTPVSSISVINIQQLHSNFGDDVGKDVDNVDERRLLDVHWEHCMAYQCFL